MRYTTADQALLPENKDKVVISNDAMAVIEYISELAREMRNLRWS